MQTRLIGPLLQKQRAGLSSQSKDVNAVVLSNQYSISGETQSARCLLTVDNNACRTQLGVEVNDAVVVTVSNETLVSGLDDDDVPWPVELVSCVTSVTAE